LYPAGKRLVFILLITCLYLIIPQVCYEKVNFSKFSQKTGSKKIRNLMESLAFFTKADKMGER